MGTGEADEGFPRFVNVGHAGRVCCLGKRRQKTAAPTDVSFAPTSGQLVQAARLKQVGALLRMVCNTPLRSAQGRLRPGFRPHSTRFSNSFFSIFEVYHRSKAQVVYSDRYHLGTSIVWLLSEEG